MLHVTWEEMEPVDMTGMPSRVAVFRGTTLVLGGDDDGRGRHRVLSCLTTDTSPEQQRARKRTLRRLADEGRLQFSHDGTKPSEVRPLAPIVSARVANDTLRLRGTARLLHLGRSAARMSDELVVYAYNVLFGDGLLVQFPDDGVMRSIVIDIGNFKGKDQPLVDAVDDIIARTQGHIDLYVMTHEHLDHVQGLLAASKKGKKPKIDHIWMTASAAPDYYQKHRKAERKKRELRNAALALGRALGPKNMDKAWPISSPSTPPAPMTA